MKSSLYMAHPFFSRDYMRKWELAFEEKTGIEIVNPFYDITRKDIGPIDAGRKDRYDFTDEDKKLIVTRDILQIAKSDGVIAIIDGNKSYGTIMEMVYAKQHNIPVYTVVTCGDEEHPWIYYHSAKIFTSLDDMALEVEDIFGENKKLNK